MVRIDRVSTGTGDRGETALGDGRRVPKDHPLVVAMGAVDEANCALGLAAAAELDDDLVARLHAVQNDLFDLGSDLAVSPGGPHEARIPRIGAVAIDRLDAWLADAEARLQPLTSFVLPGGSEAAARLHLARAVVRRAERAVVAAREALADRGGAPEVLRYLNRLSDCCFQWARIANGDGRDDLLWRPGG